MLAKDSDRKIGVPSLSNSSLIDHYTADVLSAQDYYPFGMLQPGRTWNGGSYRYGFNGKENDNEPKGLGTLQDYGMRMYDPRLGKFLSVDPIAKDYPELTTYQFASNSPIFGIDRDGLELFGNNWLFDIWVEWKFGDPTGAKKLLTGSVQKAKVESRQMAYHNENVPQPVQNKLDHINNIDANAKIAAGSAHVTKFAIKTSAEVSSNIVPLGEVINFSAKSLYGLSRYSGRAQALAYKFAEEVFSNTPKGELPRAVTAIIDTKTGRIFYGRSGTLKNTENLNPRLQELLPKESLEKWSVTNCAECDALNTALNQGAEIRNLEMHTLKLNKKAGTAVEFERCANCKETTKNVKTTSDK